MKNEKWKALEIWNATRSADLGRSQTKMPLKCSLPDARRARTKRPADTQQSRPNPQFSFDSKTCGLRKVRLRENTETFDTSRGRAAPPEIRDDVQKKKPAPRTTVLTPPTLAGPIAGEMGFKVEADFILFSLFSLLSSFTDFPRSYVPIPPRSPFLPFSTGQLFVESALL